MGRVCEQACERPGGSLGTCGGPGMERGGAVLWEPRQTHPAEGRAVSIRGAGAEALRAQARSVWPEMVSRLAAPGVGRERQPSVRMGAPLPGSGAGVHGTPGSGQSNRMVAAPPRAVGQWRRYRGQVHTFLEHTDGAAHAVRGHGVAGVQPGLVQAFLGAGEHARLLPEPDPGVEVPEPDPGCQADRTFVQGPVPGNVSRRGVHSHRCWGRDPQVLECVQQG